MKFKIFVKFMVPILNIFGNWVVLFIAENRNSFSSIKMKKIAKLTAQLKSNLNLQRKSTMKKTQHKSQSHL